MPRHKSVSLPVVSDESPGKAEMTAKECFGMLFKKWSGVGVGKGKRESRGSVDLKEFSKMLKAHQLKVMFWSRVLVHLSCLWVLFRACMQACVRARGM